MVLSTIYLLLEEGLIYVKYMKYIVLLVTKIFHNKLILLNCPSPVLSQWPALPPSLLACRVTAVLSCNQLEERSGYFTGLQLLHRSSLLLWSSHSLIILPYILHYNEDLGQ